MVFLLCRLSHLWPTFEILIWLLIGNATSSHTIGPLHLIYHISLEKINIVAFYHWFMTSLPVRPVFSEPWPQARVNLHIWMLSLDLTLGPWPFLKEHWPHILCYHPPDGQASPQVKHSGLSRSKAFIFSNFKFLWIAPEMAPIESSKQSFWGTSNSENSQRFCLQTWQPPATMSFSWVN